MATTVNADAPKDPVEANPASVPWVFDGETLAVFVGDVGPFSPEERAQAATERLQNVVDDWERNPSHTMVRSVDDEDLTEVYVAGRVIMAVTEQDAKAAGKTRLDLAHALRERLQQAIVQARVRHATRWMILGGIKASVATALLVAGIILVRVSGRRIRRRLDVVAARAGQQEALVPFCVHVLCVVSSLMLRLLTWPLVALLGLVYLHFILQFFPSTIHLAKSLDHSLLSVLGTEMTRAVAYSPNLLIIALIALATRCLLKVAHAVLEEFERGQLRLSDFSPDWARPTYNILRSIVLALMVVVAYPYLPGSESAAFRGVSVFLGLLLSLGSSSVIANAVAGTILTYLRAMYPGDFVQLGELTGTVVDKSLLVTRIRTIKNEVVTVPNGAALSTQVRNYSVLARREGVILATSVPIGYDVPWRTVHKLLLAAAQETEGVLSDPPAFVLQTAMTENFVRYELNVHTDRPDLQPVVLSALHQNIQDQFQEAGVTISNPSYVVMAPQPADAVARNTPPLKVAP